MPEVQVGAVREERILVTTEVVIDFLGMDAARVLSTPHMIGFMERACRDLALEFLDRGYDTVGTHVDVHHLAAARLGSSVTFRAEITAVDGRKVYFRMEANGENEKIGEGLHERTVINVQKFAAKLAAKNNE